MWAPVAPAQGCVSVLPKVRPSAVLRLVLSLAGGLLAGCCALLDLQDACGRVACLPATRSTLVVVVVVVVVPVRCPLSSVRCFLPVCLLSLLTYCDCVKSNNHFRYCCKKALLLLCVAAAAPGHARPLPISLARSLLSLLSPYSHTHTLSLSPALSLSSPSAHARPPPPCGLLPTY